MVKRTKTMTPGRFAVAAILNIVIAGLLFSLLSAIMPTLGETGSIFSLVVTFFVLVFVVPAIFKARPGKEVFMSLVLAIPVGVIGVQLLELLFNVSILSPALDSSGVFSVSFAIFIGMYFLADWLRGNLMRRF